MRKTAKSLKISNVFGFTRKIPTNSKVCRCCCNFFDENLDDFHDFCSECVLFHKKSTTNFGRSPFFKGKVTIFIGRTKTRILPKKN